MKTMMIAILLTLTAAPALAESCSDRFAACQRPRGGGRCDTNCQQVCDAQMSSCMRTGTFQTRNTSKTGLDKR